MYRTLVFEHLLFFEKLKGKNRSRVFIGFLEIANVSSGIAEALRTQGITSEFVSFSTSRHAFGYKTDIVLFLFKKSPIYGINRLLKYYYFFKMVFTYNTFLFISPESLLPNNRDLLFLRFFKKKIYFLFTGCVERDPSFDLENPNFICNRCIDHNWQKKFHCEQVEIKKKLVQNIEKYADKIIAAPDSAAFLKNKNTIWPFIATEKPLNLDYIKKYETNIFRIAHLPSNPLVKQSRFIIPVLEQIASERKAEIVIKDSIWERIRILDTLINSHIIVDSFGHLYGMLSVEAMARGCVILNSFDPWLKENVPDAPIYKTSAETLYDDLVFLINNKDVLKDYARRSIEYYHKYHSPKAVGKYYKEKLGLA